MEHRARTAIDLFCGAGGVTTGLKLAGYEVVAAVESDDAAAASYSANHSDVTLKRDDIRAVDPDELREELGIKRGELDLLTACPPCQGFSTLGKGDQDDERNNLILTIWDFVKTFRPRAVILENVPGLARDSRLEDLLRKLRAVGYGANHWIVDAADFGVPQRRKRLIVIAALGRKKFQFPVRLEDELPADYTTTRTPASVFAVLPAAKQSSGDPLHVERRHSDSVKRRIETIPVGGNRFDLPEEHQLECHRRLKSRNATGPYGRIKLHQPAPTMTTRCTTASCGAFVHPTEHRSITLREAALLQSFPPKYEFRGKYDEIERQIGNALPAELGHGLGLVVSNLLVDQPSDSARGSSKA